MGNKQILDDNEPANQSTNDVFQNGSITQTGEYGMGNDRQQGITLDNGRQFRVIINVVPVLDWKII
jgi:hypothetical protein